MMYTMCVCFFFQAEDGIRDADVTGLQTCALPIYRHQLNVRQVSECAQSSAAFSTYRSEEHTSELQSRPHLVCRLLLEKKKMKQYRTWHTVDTGQTLRQTPGARVIF